MDIRLFYILLLNQSGGVRPDVMLQEDNTPALQEDGTEIILEEYE